MLRVSERWMVTGENPFSERRASRRREKGKNGGQRYGLKVEQKFFFISFFLSLFFQQQQQQQCPPSFYLPDKRGMALSQVLRSRFYKFFFFFSFTFFFPFFIFSLIFKFFYFYSMPRIRCNNLPFYGFLELIARAPRWINASFLCFMILFHPFLSPLLSAPENSSQIFFFFFKSVSKKKGTPPPPKKTITFSVSRINGKRNVAMLYFFSLEKRHPHIFLLSSPKDKNEEWKWFDGMTVRIDIIESLTPVRNTRGVILMSRRVYHAFLGTRARDEIASQGRKPQICRSILRCHRNYDGEGQVITRVTSDPWNHRLCHSVVRVSRYIIYREASIIGIVGRNREDRGKITPAKDINWFIDWLSIKNKFENKK